jgi:hypothetical protein
MQDRSLLLSMLRRGKNGEEILKILDAITESDATVEQTTEF